MSSSTANTIDMQTIDDAILLALGDDILNNGPPTTHREKRFLSALSSSLVAFMAENPTMDIKQAIRHFEKNNPHFPPADGRCVINEALPDEVLAMIFECGVEQEWVENWEYSVEEVEEVEGMGCGDEDCECAEGHDDEEEEEEEDGWKKAKRTKKPVLVKPQGGRPGQATVEDASDSSASTDSEDGRPGPSRRKRRIIIPKDAEIHDDDGDEDYEDVDDDDEEEDQNEQRLLPFPVLTSHVCKRWRDISLRNPKLWTTIIFNKRLKTELARLYIERSQSLPLTIQIDCMIPEDMDEEDHPDHPLFKENMSRFWDRARDRPNVKFIDAPDGTVQMVPRNPQPSLKKPFLSTTDLTEILELIEPVVNRWKVFDFQATTYGSVHLLMTRLAKLTSAPLLKKLELYHFEECDDFEQFSGDDKTAYLPFGGNAPMLESCVFWGVHIDWQGALPFLKRVKTLEMSYHAKDVRPSYTTFVEMIQGNPDLKKLDLSLSGPALTTESLQSYDAPIAEGGWGTTPVEFPAIETLVLQYHECQYANALISHFRFPNVRELEIDFIEEDFSDLARTLASPLSSTSTILPTSATARRAASGSSSFDTPSILSQLTTVKIGALPGNLTALEAFLGELTRTKTFKIKLGSTAEEIMLQKLGDPQFGRRPKRERPVGASEGKDKGPGEDEDEEDEDLLAIAQDLGALPEALVNRPDIPMLYLPVMEELVVCNAEAGAMKAMLVKRTALGAPKLKKIMFSDGSRVALDEKDSYLKEYADEVTYFCPSDSEDDEDEEDWVDEDEDDEEYEDEEGDEDEEEGEEEVEEEEVFEEEESPLFAILGRPRRVRGRQEDEDDN